jgi:hypothetical protein
MYPKPILGPGLCECGCGQVTGVAPRTATCYGWVKGQHFRFAFGHQGTSGPVAFWGNVPDHLPVDACWEWHGTRNAKGYGVFSGKMAHRLTYAHAFGPIQDDLFVCHHCDNPPCVNTAHLFLGTNMDNLADMVAKGRRRPGFKITRADAENIKARYAKGGIRQTDLAHEYGVSQAVVSAIVVGKIWRQAKA